MKPELYVEGRRLKLDPRRTLGSGGEADVFDLGGGRALKLFKGPDHPDYQGQPEAQKAAEERIATHQRKLRDFPRGLPAAVVGPEQLVTDRSGGAVLGYLMARVDGAEPLFRYAEPAFRRSGVSNAAVADLFRAMHATVAALHAGGVVVGDFNDLNVLVAPGGEARFIDADSFQFGPFPCRVFTERFVDPRLCEPAGSGLRLAQPYDPDADWYALAALLMQSLLFVGPYGGVYRPAASARRVPPAARPLHRLSVFHPEVVYPKPATPWRVLPDELVGYLRGVFAEGRRGAFPLALLETLRFAVCPRCGVEHARSACPVCDPAAASARPLIAVRGEVVCTTVFETRGAIVCAAVEGGELRFVHHDAGAYRREDGAIVMRGALDPGLRFVVLGRETLVGRAGDLAVVSPDGASARLAVDGAGGGPVFASNGRHRYWTAQGRLHRDAPALGRDASEAIGDVLADRTRIWVGPAFGLGLYQAGHLTIAFVFDAERRGINDTLRVPPVRGQIVDAACALDDRRAWLFLAVHGGGKMVHRCLVYARDGRLEAVSESEAGAADPASAWLGTLSGKCATQGLLFAATDAGVVRVEVDGGAIRKTRDFPDTEPFVDGSSHLLMSKAGLTVVGHRKIATLKMK
jgi:hypothetical protein